MRFFGLCLLALSLLTSSCMMEEGGVFEGVYRGKKPWTGWWTPGDTVEDVGYQPDQPIPFSHVIHAGQNNIPCEYCHSGARRSSAAVIPGLNTCMGCHNIVKTDSPMIQFIAEKHRRGEPVKWVKVHDMPDFVRFAHSPHINAGVECATCHGQVQEMDVVQQVAPLQMGWCVDCHREREATTSCLACHY